MTDQRQNWRAFQCRKDRMESIAFGPDRILVAPPTREAWEALADVLLAHNYELRTPDTDSYNCREIKDGGAMSLHSFGIALDINWNTNPYQKTPDRRKVRFSGKPTQGERAEDVRLGRADTDMTPEMIADILAIKTNSGHQVFVWGGNWNTIKDTMHFEIAVAPAELATGVDRSTVRQPASGATWGTPRGVLVGDDAVLAQGAEGPRVRALQAALAARALPVGKVDGDFGPNTLAALKAFQAAQGLPVTGVGDAATLAALGLTVPPSPLPSPPLTPTPLPPLPAAAEKDVAALFDQLLKGLPPAELERLWQHLAVLLPPPPPTGAATAGAGTGTGAGTGAGAMAGAAPATGATTTVVGGAAPGITTPAGAAPAGVPALTTGAATGMTAATGAAAGAAPAALTPEGAAALLAALLGRTPAVPGTSVADAQALTEAVASPVDRALGGGLLTGKKTALAVAAYALMSILQGTGVAPVVDGVPQTTGESTVQILYTLILAFGGLGLIGKADRVVNLLGLMAAAQPGARPR